jgi:hypothetical protein
LPDWQAGFPLRGRCSPRRRSPSRQPHDVILPRFEPATITVHDCPYRPDGFAPDVKRNKQALFRRRRNRQRRGVRSLEVWEQKGTVTIKYVSAGTGIARRPATDMRFPHALDGWPIESLPFIAWGCSARLRPDVSASVTCRIVSANVSRMVFCDSVNVLASATSAAFSFT